MIGLNIAISRHAICQNNSKHNYDTAILSWLSFLSTTPFAKCHERVAKSLKDYSAKVADLDLSKFQSLLCLLVVNLNPS